MVSLMVLVLALAPAADEIVSTRWSANSCTLIIASQFCAATTIAVPMPPPIYCDLTVKSASHDKMYAPLSLPRVMSSAYNVSHSGETLVRIVLYSIIVL